MRRQGLCVRPQKSMTVQQSTTMYSSSHKGILVGIADLKNVFEIVFVYTK